MNQSETIWIVRNPCKNSELIDTFFSTTVRRLSLYIIGCGYDMWESENHSIYEDEESAKTDAVKRLGEIRNPPDLPGGLSSV